MTVLRQDAWLGEILGRDAWQVPLGPDGLDDTTRAAIVRLRGPAFLFAKVPTTDIRCVAALGALGFHVVDTNVTLERPAPWETTTTIGTRCRLARPEDREAVASLAERSFACSRLHLDPDVSRQAADRSRAEWAGNYFAGHRGDHMVVAEKDGGCAGFLQLLGPRDGVLTIDLIGVDPACRRNGIARDMIGFAIASFKDTEIVRVGTQVANIPSLRLYESLGFRTTATSYVLHCHKA